MGNSASSHSNPISEPDDASQPNPSRPRTNPPSPLSPTRTLSTVPSPRPPVHRSLRTKKKSLELPDLASLTLTPAHSPGASPHGPYRRPKASSPIPIPASPQHLPNGEHSYHSFGPQRPAHLQSNLHVPNAPSAPPPAAPSDSSLAPPCTHIPIIPPTQRPRAGNPYYPAHSRPDVRYASTRSFSSRGEPEPAPPAEGPEPPPFRSETVHSTIPLGLAVVKTESSTRKAPERPRELVPTKIAWHGGGKAVFLARAGDDNWKNRMSMERDDASTTFTAWVPLPPGTHHLKFVVDDQWRVADDLPTAVDDDGSLANYVNVPLSGFTPPSPTSPDKRKSVHTAHQISFWSDIAPQGPAPWVDTPPSELLAAARAEEAYLALTAAGHEAHAPNIPPAPFLPRHLDKLILNARPAPPKEREGRRGAEKEREKGSRTRARSRTLGMTDGPREAEEVHALERATEAKQRERDSKVPLAQLGGPALADDASVLPVPSHVVLHHLSTSAIRNGVLAVGNTTRYKKKFITTIYYKPT